MPYIPEWEQLAGAVKRIMASSVEEDQAKRDLCNAIADGKISVRVTINQHNKPDRFYFSENVGIPKHLQPINIDWINSRPTTKWWIGPALGQHYSWDGGEERIDLIEVARADVTEQLCSNETRFADPASGERLRTVEGEMSETAPGTPISPSYPPMSESDMKGELPSFLKKLKAQYQQGALRLNQDVARDIASEHFKKFIDRERFRVAYRDAGLNQLGGRPRKIPPKS
jgi:hypothetical protein